MKRRIRNKAYDCAHHVYEDFLVTDDPYPIHNTEDYCKLGKYNNTWTSPEKKVSLCEHCKRFCASRPMIRKQRERKVFYKEVERDWNRNYCAAVRAGVAQEDNGVISLDLVYDKRKTNNRLNIKKLILLALLAVIMAGCRNGDVCKRSGDSCIVTELDGCEYIMLRSGYGFQHKGNCKFCEYRDSIKWEKRKQEIINELK